MAERFPLKAYRFSTRKPYLEIDGKRITLFLAGFFGRHRWSFDASAVGVCDVNSLKETPSARAHPIAGGVFMPYLFTTGPYTTPTTALLFRTPLRVPPLRLAAAIAPNSDIPVGFFESRSRRGADLDGVLLRFEDPAAAFRALEAAGAESVSDADAWLAAQRRVLSPSEAVSEQRKQRQFVWIARSQFLFLGLFVALLALAGHDPSWFVMLPFVAAIAARPVASWAMKRHRRRERAVPRQSPD